MHKHAYLRAYMAGIVVPTVFLLFALAAFTIVRLVYRVPVPIERLMVFPMALVPNLWGLWNMVFVALHSRRHLPLGIHGALLVFVLVPIGLTLARLLDIWIVTPRFIASVFPIVLPVALVVYYLAWKYVVGFCNEVLGIA